MTKERQYPDVMLDIETMGLHPSRSLILSIGAVRFDPRAVDLAISPATLTLIPNRAEQLLKQRTVEPGTQKFWAEQPAEASKHWADGHEAESAADVERCLRHFCEGAERVWAWGIVFDLGNISDYLRQFGLKEPWRYNAACDARSFVKLSPMRSDVMAVDIEQILHHATAPFGALVQHEPIADCVTQIGAVWSHWQG